MLYPAGASPKQGRVDQGDTITDHDEEEISRRMTVSTGAAYAEWGKTKINLLDTPGFNIFVHEVQAAMVPVEAALVVVDGSSGVEIVTQRVWGFAEQERLPRILVASRMDRDRASFERVLESM